MPSEPRQQRKFVEKLESFTESLGDIVDILKEDVKDKKASAMEDLAKNLKDNIVQISEDIKVIKDELSSLKTDTDSIKQSIEELKTQKEQGLPGHISKEGKQTFVEGISTIILIGGAVMAIGAAFKLIGDVDFTSVIALSGAIYILAKAFEAIGKLEMDMTDAVKTTGMVMILSTTLVGSYFLLNQIETMETSKLMTIMGLSAALGGAVYLMGKSISGLDSSNAWVFPLIPFIVPATMLGIASSSHIIAQTYNPEAEEKVGMGFLKFVGLSGLALLTFTPTIYALSKVSDKGSLALGLVGAVGTSAAIVATSLIFSGGLWLAKDVLGIDGLSSGGEEGEKGGLFTTAPSWKWSLESGLALLAFSPAIFLLGSLSNQKSMWTGVLGVIAVSASILLSDLIMSGRGIQIIGNLLESMGVSGDVITGMQNFEPNYDIYPSWDWSLGTGLALIAFTPAIGVLSILSSKLGASNMFLGILGVFAVSSAMFLSSIIISGQGVRAIGSLFGLEGLESFKPDYDNYPSLGWSIGTGAALLAFSVAVLGIGAIMMTGIGAGVLVAGAAGVAIVAGGIVGVGAIFNKSDVDFESNYPTTEWSKGVGLSLLAFVPAMLLLGPVVATGLGAVVLSAGIKGVDIVAEGITSAAKKFNESNVNFEDNYPTQEWAEGVGKSILMFAKTLTLLKMIDEDPEYFPKFITTVSAGMVSASWQMAAGTWGIGHPSESWAEGVGTSISKFSEALVNANKVYQENRGISSILGGDEEGVGSFFVDFIKSTSWGLVHSSTILGSGSWNSNYPSEEWAEGVGKSIKTFSDILIETEDKAGGWFSSGSNKLIDFIKDIATAMTFPANKFEQINWNSSIIPKEWSDNIKYTIQNLSDFNENQSSIEFLEYLNEKIDEIVNDGLTENINTLSNSFENLSDSLNRFSNIAGQSLSYMNNLSMSMSIISALDTQRVTETLNIIGNKTNELQTIMSSSSYILDVLNRAESARRSLDNTENREQGEEAEETTTVIDTESKKFDYFEQMVNYLHNIDSKLSDIFDIKQKEQQQKEEEEEKEEEDKGKNTHDKEN